MATIVDARGLACPQPVLRTRQAMQGSDEVVTIVDNETARHNVTRMAQKQGYSVAVEERADGIYLTLHRSMAGSGPQEGSLPSSGEDRTAPAGPLVVMIASDILGRGEHEELGRILMRSFFHTLGEVQPSPEVVIFLNSGVKLVAEGSPILEELRHLADAGVQLYACGTCLDYYGLKDRIAVGEISNMYSIAEMLLGAGRVVAL